MEEDEPQKLKLTEELRAKVLALKIENPSDASLVDWILNKVRTPSQAQLKWLHTLVERGGARFKN